MGCAARKEPKRNPWQNCSLELKTRIIANIQDLRKFMELPNGKIRQAPKKRQGQNEKEKEGEI